MYADENYSYVQKDEMDRRVLETEGHVSQALSSLFREVSHVLKILKFYAPNCIRVYNIAFSFDKLF